MTAHAATRTVSRAVAAGGAATLALEHVTHAYDDVVAVRDLSLSVAEGEIVCLVGPSGCGKSTLLRLAAGLETLQQGRILIGPREVAVPRRSEPPERRGVGLVFQDYALFPHLDVLNNVRFGLRHLPAAEQRRLAEESLARVGMAGFAHAFPHTLSGGQQQRVALARALAPRPPVLLLDEPFSGLDVSLRAQVRDQTLHVLKAHGAATLVVTHDPEEAMFLADRIALMRDGRLVQEGSPVDLYMRPVDAFAASFFGEVNRMAGVVRDEQVETPLGTVPAPELSDDAAVTVLIRPEALHLSLSERIDGVRARVEAARLLGRTSLVHLGVEDGQGGEMHLHARMPGQFLPMEDSFVTISLDARQAFVFPAE